MHTNLIGGKHLVQMDLHLRLLQFSIGLKEGYLTEIIACGVVGILILMILK